MANIRFGNEPYKVEQIIPCQGNWIAVGQAYDTKQYFYVPIAAWALVIYEKSEHLEAFQAVMPLITDGDGGKSLEIAELGFVGNHCFSDDLYQFLLNNPDYESDQEIPSLAPTQPVLPSNLMPLRGTVKSYDEPSEPAIASEDWEALK
jgi:hypothetical protein